MTDRRPIQVTNLDRCGNPALSWSRAHDLLAFGPKGPLVGFFLGTVRPDGRPHAAGIGAVWHEGDLYFTSGPGTRKSPNLAADPACTISVKLPGLDLTLEGTALRVTEQATLARVAGTTVTSAGRPRSRATRSPRRSARRARDRRRGRCTGSPSRPSPA